MFDYEDNKTLLVVDTIVKVDFSQPLLAMVSTLSYQHQFLRSI